MPEPSPFTIPDDASIVVAEVYVVSYIREDGSQGYQVSNKGDVNMTSYLGLLDVAKADILEWRKD